ncbi:MAG: response regulator [Nitrosopumilales archaeon CG15_BIG_FIL_POST_REV_8_21_14_020_37_12]|nr:MAG: response regulator [Nitrosopumilales archaeon CG15_BIG_FIL_POST_REV_8_21_14_020_37_12]
MKRTAIVIDDQREIVELLAEILQLQGFKVLGMGYNGHDAIKLFEQYEPEFVFSDVHMPDLNGIEAVRKIRKRSTKVKIVLVTADMSQELENTVQEEYVNAVIFKPFSIEKLNQVLDLVNSSQKLIIQKR